MKELSSEAVAGWTPLPRAAKASAEETRAPSSPIDAKFAYTISEVGDLLGFCRATIYKLIAAGELRTVNLSDRAPRVLRDELLQFLERKKAEAEAVEESVRRKFRARSPI